jgi:DNA-binding IclR family transcriptional regulator
VGSHLPPVEAQANLSVKMPIETLAAGWAIAAQLDDATLDQMLPAEPYPDAGSVFADITAGPAAAHVPPVRGAGNDRDGLPHSPRTRDELNEVLAVIRRTGFSLDLGSAHPGIHCIAVPWRQPALPASLGCLGPPDLVATNATLIRRALSVAAEPGATARDVVLAAADVMSEESS